MSSKTERGHKRSQVTAALTKLKRLTADEEIEQLQAQLEVTKERLSAYEMWHEEYHSHLNEEEEEENQAYYASIVDNYITAVAAAKAVLKGKQLISVEHKGADTCNVKHKDVVQQIYSETGIVNGVEKPVNSQTEVLKSRAIDVTDVANRLHNVEIVDKNVEQIVDCSQEIENVQDIDSHEHHRYERAQDVVGHRDMNLCKSDENSVSQNVVSKVKSGYSLGTDVTVSENQRRAGFENSRMANFENTRYNFDSYGTKMAGHIRASDQGDFPSCGLLGARGEGYFEPMRQRSSMDPTPGQQVLQLDNMPSAGNYGSSSYINEGGSGFSAYSRPVIQTKKIDLPVFSGLREDYPEFKFVGCKI